MFPPASKTFRFSSCWFGIAFAYLSLVVLLPVGIVATANLPPHGPLRILIVSDEVNPHSLPDEELTQPGSISAEQRNRAPDITHAERSERFALHSKANAEN
jgi:hypothetical protein